MIARRRGNLGRADSADVLAHLRPVHHGVVDVALLAAGAAHEDATNPFGAVARHRRRALRRLVVGMRVHGEEAEGFVLPVCVHRGHGSGRPHESCDSVTLVLVDSPETWRWIWLGVGVIFLLGEMHAFGSFFLLPFAIGAFVAAVLAFLGVGVGWEWLAFVLVSLGSLACLYPLRHRLDRARPAEGIGSRRLIGQPAVVLQDVPAGPSELGLVRVGREEWRAESRDGRPLPAGTNVRVIDVQGTRVIVWPVDEIANPNDLKT